VWRLLIERHDPFVEEPFFVGQAKPVEGRAQWLDPGRVFMQHKDARHLRHSDTAFEYPHDPALSDGRGSIMRCFQAIAMP
jgi:hypothetical protein